MIITDEIYKDIYGYTVRKLEFQNKLFGTDYSTETDYFAYMLADTLQSVYLENSCMEE